MKKVQARGSIVAFTIMMMALLVLVGCNADDAASNDNNGGGNDGTTEELDGTDDAPATGPQTGGTIRIGVSQEPDTLDIHKTSMGITTQVATHFGSSLLAVNPETNEVEPYLAEDFTVSDDGLVLTFTLREGVVFHDGTPLTAERYKETFERILDPDTGAAAVASFVGEVSSVSAPDDRTFVIELVQPSAPFIRNLAQSTYLQPLPIAAVGEAGNDFGRKPVGVGPWVVEDWVTGQPISLVRNEDFNWAQSFFDNDGKPYPDRLEYRFITDPQTLLAALDSGSIDIAHNVSARDAQRYRNHDDFYVIEAELQGLGLFLQMNLENEILQDLEVRKALNKAINKDVLIESILSGEGSPAYGPLPQTIFGYDPNVENYGHHYNKDEAAALLENAGWVRNNSGTLEKDGVTLSFELSSMPENNQAAQIVQAMLREIGIDVNIQSYDAGTLIERVSQGEYELSFMTYGYTDPDILNLFFHSSMIGGLNHTRISDPDLDALLEKGRVTLDEEERAQIYAEVQQIVVDEAVWVPLYANKMFHIVNKRVPNVIIANNALILHDSWVEQ
ncbi:MAG: ABC transporter substrate-binding protein [Bacillus sp. (in: Bacteria)]|nr:ABC transporter substrate-binding protein [Bacillus sp. (in: firmicutes)]